MTDHEEPDDTETLEEKIIAIARALTQRQPTVHDWDEEAEWHSCGVCGEGLAMDDDPSSHADGCLWVRLRDAVQKLDKDDNVEHTDDQVQIQYHPDIHIKAGDTWPPMHLSSEQVYLDISAATTVRRSIDGGLWEDAEVIDPQQGTVKMPRFDEGTHVVEYEIDWGDGKIETVPNHPQRIIAHRDVTDAER